MKNISEVFKALGDPTRLEIVRLLIGKELCVCDIIDSFQVSQPTISHHLRVLKQADLVKDKKEGKWIYYSLNSGSFEAIEKFFEQYRTSGKVERVRTCSEEE
ncbi:MAG: metalloregulator ArsR/SmtB family transcription factor [Sporomusaceae bacterium]|nr:metalloregulator ArsR/SmtB family transcription factor [Sporomusaceae bacterium]